MEEYQDFELIVHEQDRDGKYPLFAKGPAGESSGYMELSDDDRQLNARLTQMGMRSGQESVLKEAGERLFQHLFPDSIKRLYDKSLMGNSLRIRLIVSPPELANYHWEYLYDPHSDLFLATSSKTLLIRHIPLETSVSPLAASLPLRILLLISSPSDLPALDVKRERALIQEQFEESVKQGLVELDILEGKGVTHYSITGITESPYKRRMVTALGLGEILRKEPGYHIFHFIGHGDFDEQEGTGFLALEDEQSGTKDWVSANVLRTLFADRQLRLVVLNGCETAVASERSPLLGVAPALAKGGVPAVAAMQFPVADESAIVFSRMFYGALADGYPVDAAIVQGRIGLYASFAGRRDWGAPVLFMRSSDGVLWDFQELPPPPPPPPPLEQELMNPGKRYALLVGPSYHPEQQQLEALHRTKDDVEILGRLFKHSKIGGFHEVGSLNGSLSGYKIVQEMKSMFSHLGRGDMLLLYFSGHAAIDDEGRWYFCDSEYDIEMFQSNALSLHNIKEQFIKRSQVEYIVILIDCLYHTNGAKVNKQILEKAFETLSDVSDDTQVVILSSLATGVEEKEGKQDGTHSLLTHYLAEGIEEGKADFSQNGKTTLGELYRYVRNASYFQGKLEASLEPFMWDIHAKGDLVLASTSEERLPTGKYTHIAELMKKGEVIPFLGVDAVFPRLRKVLSERLAKFTGVDTAKSSSLSLLSQYCEMKVSRRKLYDKVAEILAEEMAHTSTTVHELLVTLEKPLIVMTTMCDLLLENLFRKKNKKYILLTHLLNPRNPEYRGKVVVKYFHGAGTEDTKDKILAPQNLVIQDKELEEYSIIYKLQGCLDLQNLDIDGDQGDSLVISERDYLSLLKWFSIPNVLARPLQENMLLFLGCSMQDWSFRVLVHTILRDMKYLDCRPHAVRKSDDEIEKAFWRGIGRGEKTLELIEQDLSSFLSELAEEMEVS